MAKVQADFIFNIPEIKKNIKEIEKQFNDLSKAEQENVNVGGNLIASKKKLTEQIIRQQEANKKNRKEIRDNIKAENDLIIAEKNQIKSINDLKTVTNSLVNLRSRLDTTTKLGKEQFKKYTDRINTNTTALIKHDEQIQRNNRKVGNYSGGIKDATAKIIAMTGGIYALVRASKFLITSSAELSDVFADVQKTTGLTSDQVYKLDQQLQKLDTRTSRKGLLEIATVAGRMNIAANDIASFTAIVDKAVVSLAGELSGSTEEIATDLAKISTVFGLDEKFGVADGINKIGSAINFLGANTKAQAQPVLDFAKELQGISGIAKISIQDILGLGAGFDELGGNVSVNATSVNQLLVLMGKKTAEFAKLAGVSTEKFSNILKTDANEALLLFAQNTGNTSENLVDLVGKLDGLGLKGKKVVETIALLAGNTETFRKNQKLANDEIDRGQSLTDEFNIKNETFAANLEKIAKQAKAVVVTSGLIEWLTKVSKAIDLSKSFKLVQAVLGSITSSIVFLVKTSIDSMQLLGKVLVAPFNVMLVAAKESISSIATALSSVTSGDFSKAYESIKGVGGAINKTLKEAKDNYQSIKKEVVDISDNWEEHNAVIEQAVQDARESLSLTKEIVIESDKLTKSKKEQAKIDAEKKTEESVTKESAIPSNIAKRFQEELEKKKQLLAEEFELNKAQNEKILDSVDEFITTKEEKILESATREIEDLKLLNETKLLTDEEYILKLEESKLEHEEKLKILDDQRLEEFKARWLEKNEFLGGVLGSMESGYDTFIGNVLDKDKTGQDKRDAIWSSMKGSFIKFLGDMLKQQIINFIASETIAKAGQSAAVLSSTATGTAIAGAYSSAAALASLASFGANSIPAIAGITATKAVATGLVGLEDGGLAPKNRNILINDSNDSDYQEYVVNGNRTKKYQKQLDIINSGSQKQVNDLFSGRGMTGSSLSTNRTNTLASGGMPSRVSSSLNVNNSSLEQGLSDLSRNIAIGNQETAQAINNLQLKFNTINKRTLAILNNEGQTEINEVG